MVMDWYDGLALSSKWQPQTDAVRACYTLALHNGSDRELKGFRLGFSGPARVSEDAEIANGHVVTQLSNYCEIAPPPGFTLAPGTTWTVDIFHLDYPIRHWTDGAVTGFLIFDDGATLSLRTSSTALAEAGAPRLRGTAPFPLPVATPEPVSVIPWPRTVDVAGRRTAPSGLALRPTNEASTAAAAGFARLVDTLFAGEGLLRPAHAGGLPVELIDGAGEAEGYAIAFTETGASIAAATQTGFLYGLVTLGQILRGARFGLDRLDFPVSGRIEDGPSLRWRGSHLDVARRFYGVAEIERFLAILAWNKLNVFHWHLSDDEAWRVEIEAYPELTEIGAWRGHGLAIPPLLGSGPERTGGYYSKAEVRELVERAASWGIDIVPEIDVPGHCFAMLQAMPQLADPAENQPYSSIQSFTNNCLNPAVETVYPALETIFAELADLFPSRYFHVGADEVPADAWAGSAAANALRAELDVTGAAPLQARFLQRIQAYLTGLGKITGAWEEAAQGGGIDRDNCYLVGWHTVEASQKLASEGYDVVVAPGQAYYLDMANGPDFSECGAAWAGWSSPETTYAFDPSAGWSAAQRDRLLGVQACIWSEPMTDRAVFDRLVFPRLSAIAETGWSGTERRDFARFTAFVGLMPSLYRSSEEIVEQK